MSGTSFSLRKRRAKPTPSSPEGNERSSSTSTNSSSANARRIACPSCAAEAEYPSRARNLVKKLQKRRSSSTTSIRPDLPLASIPRYLRSFAGSFAAPIIALAARLEHSTTRRTRRAIGYKKLRTGVSTAARRLHAAATLTSRRMHDAARQIASNALDLVAIPRGLGLARPNFLLTGSERNAQEPVSTRQRQEVQGPEDCWPQPLAPGHSGRGARQARRHLSRRLPGVVRWRDQERRLGRRYPPRTAARGARAIWAVPCRRRRAGRSAGGGHPGDRTLATRRIRGLSQAWAGAIPGCSPRRMEEAS